jgi:hypothetical protein
VLVCGSIGALYRILVDCAYLLQGLGLLIRNPLILTIVWGCLLGGRYFDSWIISILNAMFVIWIVIKDNRIELAIGIGLAHNLFRLLITIPDDNEIKFPTILEANFMPPLLPTLLTYLLRAGLFYLICFGWRRNLPEAEPR